MALIQNRHFQRVAITALIAMGGWVVREAIVPGMALYQHIIATVTFVIFIQIVWEIYERLHRLLDRWLPFRKYLYARIVVQLALGVLILLAIRMLLLIPLQNRFPAMRDRVVLTMMLVANIGMALAINLLFISAHFIREWKDGLVRVADAEKGQVHLKEMASAVKDEPPARRYKEDFLVHQGAASVLVEDRDIAGFIKRDLIFLLQVNGRKLVTAYRSLDEVEAIVDPARYFRANRQCLIHRRMIQGYKTGPQSKLTLSVPADMGEPVSVSKEKAAAFRKWFDTGVDD